MTAPLPSCWPPGRPVPARAVPRGRAAHDEAVRRFQTSFAAIPAGSPVRLAKTTSNLFRVRTTATTTALDPAGLDGVVDVDPQRRTADVQGMCRYEDLVAATLPHGLVPAVVPQLRTITLGGAVTGLGVESASFRAGLPHEAVRELDVLTGDGSIVTATPTGEHAELYAAFPNSYGCLGYAVRLRIELEPAEPYVRLRHVRFDRLQDLQDAIARVCDRHEWDGTPVDFVDGVVFDATESYLTFGRWAGSVVATSDYTDQAIYYRSLRERGHDALSAHDYLWRWDTDWFWCSAAFGAQHPLVRRLWPARYRRSDVFHRLIRLEERYRPVARWDALRGRPPRERVIQDVEVPGERTAEFLDRLLTEIPLRPVWVCPLQLRGNPAHQDSPSGRATGLAGESTGLAGESTGRTGRTSGPAQVDDDARTWPLFPLPVGHPHVNVGFWGTVPIAPGTRDGEVTRRVHAAVDAVNGQASLYSDAYWGEEEFRARYGGERLAAVKRRYDPQNRLSDLYTKVVRRG